MMSKTAAWSLVAAVAILGAAACSTVKGEPELRGWATTTTVASPTLAVGSASAPPAVEVPADAATPSAFAFDAIDLDGGLVAGTDLFERRPIVMSFVVPTCPVCVTEAPELARAARNRPDVAFVIVHSGGTAVDYRRWIEAGGIDAANVVHVADDDMALWHRFGVTAQPSSVLVDGTGSLRTVVGALGEDGLARAIDLVTS